MKKVLLIVAMLLMVSPVMATVTITAVNEGTKYADVYDVNRLATIRVSYSSDINVRAFALDINIDSNCTFGNIRDFNVGENNSTKQGYGIFPGRFRTFVNPANPNWVDTNYSPLTPYGDPGTTNTGTGWPIAIVEMGYLGATDANMPAKSGTLFRIDVNAYGFAGTAYLTINPDTMRGGVVSKDTNATTGSTNLPTTIPVIFPSLCVTPTNEVGQTQAAALAVWGTGGGQGFTNIVGTPSTVCPAGLVITNDQNCISLTTQLNYTYGVAPTVPNEVNVLLATAETAITNAGLTYTVAASVNSNTIAYGNVISTSPVAGTQTCSSVTITPSAGCFPITDPNYSSWVSLGKPHCWCFPRQCHGDADGLAQGTSKLGYYYVGENDLAILVKGWKVLEPPKGPGIQGEPNICADFAHDVQGTSKLGYYRVGENDLARLVQYWKVLESPKGTGTPANCGGTLNP